VRGLSAVLAIASLAACSRPAPDSTPEGAVRAWLDKMESQPEDPRAARDALQLLGPSARANLEQRADRASRIMGRRVDPYEMLAEGRFGLKFRPKTMTSRIDGEKATVDIVGSDPAEHAVITCAHEPAGWRVEPELPDPAQPAPAAPRADGGS
jgi:hypothetical protein